MKKNLFLAALAFVAMASCTSDEFVGENTSPTPDNAAGAIQFGSEASKITRATKNTGTVSQMLDGQFKVYGTKNVKNGNDDAYSTVFPSYIAWNNNSLIATTSNPDGSDTSNGWEYVGTTSIKYGEAQTSLASEQTIKYWDFAAANYHFVAGSPAGNFQYITTSNDVTGATVTGLAGHISANSTGTGITTDPVYIAEPVKVEPGDYAKPVTFRFVRQQSRVRVGIFETIPGYKITEIKFYPYNESSNDWGTTSGDNIVLASTTANYFQGGASDVVVGTITYDWSTTPASYSFTYDAAVNKTLVQKKNWYGGKYNDGTDPAWTEMAITSSETNIGKLYGKDADMDAITGYFTVLPTAATTASPLLIKCDYTLTSEVDNSGETIKVYGATAAIPAAFCKWAPNTSYTYLFKISDNTNGKTNPNKPAVGLFPITFDAVAIAENNAEVGYITTVSTPSITTYQEGSVTATGIKYVPGSGKVIYFTVQDDTNGTLKTLNTTDGSVGCVKVFWLGTTAKTEADLQLAAPESSAVLSTSNPSGSTALELPSSAWSHNGQSIASGNYGTFTPGAVGYYAIQYLTTAAESSTPAAYTYKVVHVETATP